MPGGGTVIRQQARHYVTACTYKNPKFLPFSFFSIHSRPCDSPSIASVPPCLIYTAVAYLGVIGNTLVPKGKVKQIGFAGMKASLPDEDKPVAVAGNECILLKEEAGILWSRMFSLPAHQAPIFAMSVQDLDVCKPPKYDWVSPAQRLADDPSKLPDEDFDSSTNTFDIMDEQTWTSIRDKKGKAVKDTLKYVASKPAVLQGMDGIAILPGFVSTDAPDKYTPPFLTTGQQGPHVEREGDQGVEEDERRGEGRTGARPRVPPVLPSRAPTGQQGPHVEREGDQGVEEDQRRGREGRTGARPLVPPVLPFGVGENTSLGGET